MPTHARIGSIIFSAVVTLLGIMARADDWPMYGRDSTRNAVSPEKNPPLDWRIEEKDDAGKITAAGKNIRWKAELGSTTFGSPAVSGGLVWVCTNTYQASNPGIKQDAGRLMCFNERDGKLRWQYLTPRIGDRSHDGPGSVGSTPMIEGDRLWFITNKWEVVCLDIGPLLKETGEPQEVWKLDMPRDLKVSALCTVMGPSMRCRIGASYKGMIYVITGNGVDATRKRVPAPDAPSLICLEKDTGKVVWQDNSPGKNILSGQWSSPLVAEINGRAQVIAPEGDSWVRSFDAMTGKLIWSFDANPKSSIYPMTRNLLIAVPVLYENRVYVATGDDPEHSSGRGILWCIDPTREGDISEELDDGPMPAGPLPDVRRDPSRPGGARKGSSNPNSGVVWKFDKVDRRAKNVPEKDQMNRTIGSVAAADGLVIATDYAGFVHCLDARTGKQQWAHDLEAETRASPLICDGKVYVATNDGQIVILVLSRNEKLLATRDFTSSIYCSPILANGTLYVTTQSTLYAILCYALREDRSPPFESPVTRPTAASRPTPQADSVLKPAVQRSPATPSSSRPRRTSSRRCLRLPLSPKTMSSTTWVAAMAASSSPRPTTTDAAPRASTSIRNACGSHGRTLPGKT